MHRTVKFLTVGCTFENLPLKTNYWEDSEDGLCVRVLRGGEIVQFPVLLQPSCEIQGKSLNCCMNWFLHL